MSDSIKNVMKALNHEKPDALPVGPFIGNHSAFVSGIPIIDYCTKGNKMAQAQIVTWEKYKQDIIFLQSDNYYIAEGFGVKLNYHDDALPTFKAPAIENLKDISKLRVPSPWNDGRMNVYLDAIKIVKKQIGNEVVIRGTGTGPFALASHIIGTEKFLNEIAYAQYDLPEGDEPAIMELMELSTEALLQFCIAQMECGARLIHCGDSLASLDVISPETYKRYVFPFEKKFFTKLKPYAEKYKAFSLLHICGNNTKVLELYPQTGADAYEVDHKVDLKSCKEKIGDKMCLIGNVDPVQVLLRGSVQDVENAARKCIDDASKGGGFILGSGCEVPMYTPQANIEALIRVARQYKY